MLFSPRPYQSIALKRLLENEVQLLALRMGAGKTAVTLLAVKSLMLDELLLSEWLSWYGIPKRASGSKPKT